MNLFVSDIAIGDKRSSFQMLQPLLDQIQNKYGGVIVLTPKILDRDQSYILQEYYVPFYKNKLLFLRLFSEVTLAFIPYFSYLFKVENKRDIKNVIVYSPSIFLVFFVIFQKFFSYRKRRYFLILRDLFPIWARNTGLIKNQTIFSFFMVISSLQFRYFDVIGVQDEMAIDIIKTYYKPKSKLIVLRNWTNFKEVQSSKPQIRENLKKLITNKEDFVIYAGMIGEAQNLIPLLDAFQNYLITNPKCKTKLLILGEGRDKEKIIEIAKLSNGNILYSEPVTQDACDFLIKNSIGGIVSLNRNHETNNIPGKLLKYLSLGKPIIANINKNNTELLSQIEEGSLGIALCSDNADILQRGWKQFLSTHYKGKNLKKYFKNHFSFEKSANPILNWLET